jgi:hypothetical protein
LCDIDVTTKPENTITELTAALEWIEIAHKLEKAEFFSILPDEIIKKIEVPGGRD